MAKKVIQIEHIQFDELKEEIKKLVQDLADRKSTGQSDERLLTRQETADYLSVSLVTLYHWTKGNIIPAYRIGKKVRYKESEVLLALKKINNHT